MVAQVYFITLLLSGTHCDKRQRVVNQVPKSGYALPERYIKTKIFKNGRPGTVDKGRLGFPAVRTQRREGESPQKIRKSKDQVESDP